MHSSATRALRPLLVAVMLLGVSALPANAQLGVSAGLDFESMDDIRAASGGQDAALDNATGYHLGVVYDVGIGPLNVRPGLFYRRVGTYDFPSADKFDVTAVEVPLDLRLTVLPTPIVSAYVLGGPKAVFPRSDGEFEDELEDISYTFNVGVGADVSIPGVGFTLQPELRYEFGATDYVNDSFEIGGTEFTPSDRKLSAFAVRLNVLF